MEKKPGPPKKASWEDDLEDQYLQRLREGRSLETLDHECKELAKWHAGKKFPSVGGEEPISYKRIREKMRARGITAKTYRVERKKNIDRLLEAARAFLTAYEP